MKKSFSLKKHNKSGLFVDFWPRFGEGKRGLKLGSKGVHAFVLRVLVKIVSFRV